MDLSVVTVTWNAREHIDAQIASVVKACAGLQFEHYIVDNASEDATADLVAKRYPHVTVIKNGRNLGFGAANNIAAKRATGEWLLFLNPDTEITSTLKPMIDWLRSQKQIGVAGGKLIAPNGAVENRALPRRFPTWKDQLAIVFKIPHVWPRVLDRYLYSGFDAAKEQAVDSVRGAFMFVRRELVQKLGWAFDPRYYVWYEDVDTCKEAYRLGYTVVYSPRAVAIDHIGQSFKKRSLVWKQWHVLGSMARYFLKWGF